MPKRRRLVVPGRGRTCIFCRQPLTRHQVGRSVEWLHPDPNNCPSVERAAQGEIERIERVVDDEGRAASPLRAKGTLRLLAERGIIDRPTLQAGETFHEKFYLACFSSLKAVDLLGSVRSMRSREDVVTIRVKRAQDYVLTRLAVLGGSKSFAGSCAWHVIGREVTVSKWLLQCAPWLDGHAGRGILIAVLNILASDPDSPRWSTQPTQHRPRDSAALELLARPLIN